MTQLLPTRELFTKASFVLFGASGAIAAAAYIVLQYGGDGPSPVPGLRIISHLCLPMWYLWTGVLLREWKKTPKWWFQALLFCISAFCLYRYRHFTENWGHIDHLYFGMLGIGFLIPPKTFSSFTHENGWLSSVMLLLSMLCYATIATVKHRLVWRAIIPKYPDMELMMEQITTTAEPLMMLIVFYFAIQFIFSQTAQYLGSRKWFKIITVITCIYVFLLLTDNLFCRTRFFIRFYGSYISLLRFAVQPVTIWLAVRVYRFVMEHRKMNKDKMTFKESK